MKKQGESIKVSVLMAVHNAEKYLAQALDSLLGQTHQDVEIICVDDASTDSSYLILEEYREKDERVIVRHLSQNQGQAKARNIALEMATGEFIVMLDADDWYAVVSFEKALKVFRKFPQTDIVLFHIVNVEEYGRKLRFRKQKMLCFDALTGDEALRLSIDWQGIHGIYMIRADIHKRYPFDDTCLLYSDDNTARLHFAVAREVRRCTGKYFYRQHPESETHKVSGKIYDRLPARESLVSSLAELLGSRYEEFRRQMTTSLWLHVVDCYMLYHRHRSTLPKEANQRALSNMRRLWEAIDRSNVSPEVSRKFGYRFTNSWSLFRLQEEIYFALREVRRRFS